MTMTRMPAVISSSDPKPEEAFVPKPQPITDDWTKSPTRWLTNCKPDSHKPMSNECLQALRDAAAAKGGKQLTDAERKEILNKFA